jgi:hypothetical protein
MGQFLAPKTLKIVARVQNCRRPGRWIGGTRLAEFAQADVATGVAAICQIASATMSIAPHGHSAAQRPQPLQ